MQQVSPVGGNYRSDRRVDLDWLRILAFALLILFHVAMFYAPWAWEVKSPRILPATLLLVEWSAPWRLMLLFLISGAALRFMTARQSPGTLVRRRTAYLLPPLIVAVIVVVPPQAYLRAIELFGYSRGYLTFWRVFLSLVRIALEHFFPETQRLYDDWYLHAIFLSALLFGFLFFTDRRFMHECERLRWPALLLGIVAYVGRTSYTWHYQDLSIPIGLKVVMAFVYGCDQWAWIVAAAGFAYRHLVTAEGPWRRTLTEAIFPCYILHQTAIVIFAHELARLGWPLLVEIPMVLLLTALACAAGYQLIRRVPWLRPAFGMKPLPPPVPAPTVTKAGASPAE